MKMQKIQWELTLPGEPKKSRFTASFKDGLLTIERQTLLHGTQRGQQPMATGAVIVAQIPRNLLASIGDLPFAWKRVDGPDVIEAHDP